MIKTVKKILASLTVFLFGANAFAQSATLAVKSETSATSTVVVQPKSEANFTTELNDVISNEQHQPFQISVESGKEDMAISLTIEAATDQSTKHVSLGVAEYDLNKLTYSLYNKKGKLIDKEELKGPVTEIDMDGYADGTYILKVENSLAELKTFKIIKNE